MSFAGPHLDAFLAQYLIPRHFPSSESPIGLKSYFLVAKQPGFPCGVDEDLPYQGMLGAVVDDDMRHAPPFGSFQRYWWVELYNHNIYPFDILLFYRSIQSRIIHRTWRIYDDTIR